MADLKKKIMWQCRRGLWELDIILKPFVENSFEKLNMEEQLLFQELLTLEDIELFDILVNKLDPSEIKFIPIIKIILEKHLEQMNAI